MLSLAGENRNRRIFADFGNYLIKIVRPLYVHTPVPNVDIDNEIFAMDSTSIVFIDEYFKATFL